MELITDFIHPEALHFICFTQRSVCRRLRSLLSGTGCGKISQSYWKKCLAFITVSFVVKLLQSGLSTGTLSFLFFISDASIIRRELLNERTIKWNGKFRVPLHCQRKMANAGRFH